MFVSYRPKGWLIPLAAAAFFCLPDSAFAQFGVYGGNFGNFGGGNFGNLGGGNLGNLGGGGGAAGGGQQAPSIQRATNQLPNPVNYWQYSQVTGVKPIIGTVRIYNTFGTLGIQSGGGLGQGFSAGQQGGGFGGGFGGLGGGGGAGGNIPGIGATQGGDDPPQGVLLHVQYAQLFFPNQQQINQGAFGNQNQFGGGGFGGGFGGFPGYGGGFGGGGKFGGFNGGYGY